MAEPNETQTPQQNVDPEWMEGVPGTTPETKSVYEEESDYPYKPPESTSGEPPVVIGAIPADNVALVKSATGLIHKVAVAPKVAEQIAGAFDPTTGELKQEVRKEYVSASSELAPFRLEKGKFDIVKAIRQGVTDEALVTLGYKKSDLSSLRGFMSDHIRLPDAKWVPVDQWNKLPEKYQSTGIQKGFDSMLAAIEADNKAQQEAINRVDVYKAGKGYNLSKAVWEGVSVETLALAGFKQSDIDRAVRAAETSKKSAISLPGVRTWERITGEIISDVEYKKIIAERPTEIDNYRLSVPSGRRAMIEIASTLIFSPARISLPEVEFKDIPGLEWAASGAQLAGWAMPFVPKGIVPIISGIGGGVLAANLAKSWSELSTLQKSLGVAGITLYSIPAAIAIVKKAIPISVKVPLADGSQVAVWKGYTIGGKPVIGISHGRLAIGTRGVTTPSTQAVAPGYRPITKVEASIMAARKAMAGAGMNSEGIDRVVNALQIESHIKGARSPYLSKTGELQPVKALSTKGVAKVLSESTKKVNDVKQVYGSMTIREQLSPPLKGWRMPADIDIQTGLTTDGVKAFAQRLLTQLQKIEGKNILKIDPREPGLIQRLSDGAWHNAVDIHGVSPMSADALARQGTLASISKATGEYTYGLRVTEPSVKISYPGIGEVKMMALAESGKRKLDAILRWRGSGTVAPEPHRVKDIVDFYVIAKTYTNVPDSLLDEFLRLWGMSADDVAALSAKSPTRLGAFEFIPSTALTSSSTGSPAVSVSIPTYLSASVPALAKALASPSSLTSVSRGEISPITGVLGRPSASLPSGEKITVKGTISPSVAVRGTTEPSGPSALTTAASKLVSPVALSEMRVSPSRSVRSASTTASTAETATSPYPAVRPSPSRLVPSTPSISGKVMPSPSSSIVPSPAPSPGLTPSPSPPSPSPSPLTVPRPSASTSPTPEPSPSPSPVPEGESLPSPRPTTTLALRASIQGNRAKLPKGSTTWKQGAFWKWIPYEDFASGRKPRTLPKGVVPIGAMRSHLKTPRETIQMIGDPGASVPDASIDLGIADIYIKDNAQTITYIGKGESTDVGVRVPGTTQGMTVMGIAKGHAYAKKIHPKHSVSRTDVDTEEPMRGPARRTKGVSRPVISDATYPDELPFGAFFDEPVTKHIVNRTKHAKKAPPRRSRDEVTPALRAVTMP